MDEVQASFEFSCDPFIGYGSLPVKPDSTTIDIYNSKAKEYTQLPKDVDQDIRLETFATKLPEKACILDYGCGPGTSAAYFADRGIVTHAFDASKEMVKLASRHPKVTVWQAGFHEFNKIDTYDGVWASFSLLHAPRRDMNKLLLAIHKSLKAGGKFCFSVKLGKGEARDKLGRLYTYYGQCELETLLCAANFTWENHFNGSGKGLDGSISRWISVFAHA